MAGERSQLRGGLLLLLTALIWGTAFVAQSVGMDHLGPCAFTAVRNYIGCVALPVVTEDTQITLTSYLGEGEGLEGTCYLATFDEEAFRGAWEKVMARGCETRSERDSVIEVTVPQGAEASQLMLTIPYDAGWQVKVDGVPVETTTRYGQFLAVNLEAGAHTVELRFLPQGFMAGAAVSGLSLLAVAVWQVAAFRRRRRASESVRER